MDLKGRLHRVKCEWCGLKMACSCSIGDEINHILILCPRCQVTEFTNLLFSGGKKNGDTEGGSSGGNGTDRSGSADAH